LQAFVAILTRVRLTRPAAGDTIPGLPLFDFRCRSCGNEFEALVRADRAAVCACGSGDLEQRPSGFAVSSPTLRKAHLDAARKRGADARTQKLRSDHDYIQKHIRDEH
jgi:putative FmdB family regulatory protein